MRLRVLASLAAFSGLVLGLPWIQPEASVHALADKNCKDFQSWQEAQSFFLAAGAGDPNRLDTNHNGIACESLPGAPGTARSPTAVSAAAVIAAPAIATPLPTELSPTPTVTPTPHPATPPQSVPRPRSVPTVAPTTAATASGDLLEPPLDAPPDLPVAPPADQPSVTPTAMPTSVPTSTQPTSTQQVVSVWLVALAPTPILGDDDEPLGSLDVDERARLIAVGDGSALVVLPVGSGTGWIVLDERIQLVAQ